MFHNNSSIEAERRHLDFPLKKCCLIVPKNFVGSVFLLQKPSGIETERKYHDFPSKSFASVPKIFFGELFCV